MSKEILRVQVLFMPQVCLPTQLRANARNPDHDQNHQKKSRTNQVSACGGVAQAVKSEC